MKEVKEAVSIRVGKGLLKELGVEGGVNKSEKIRKILEEYVELKREVERLKAIEDELKEVKGSLEALSEECRKLAERIKRAEEGVEQIAEEVAQRVIARNREDVLNCALGGAIVVSFILLLMVVARLFGVF